MRKVFMNRKKGSFEVWSVEVKGKLHGVKKSWFILFYWQRSEGKQCYKSYTAGFQGVTVPENVIFF